MGDFVDSLGEFWLPFLHVAVLLLCLRGAPQAHACLAACLRQVLLIFTKLDSQVKWFTKLPSYANSTWGSLLQKLTAFL